jgi:putative addiction module killer protein
VEFFQLKSKSPFKKWIQKLDPVTRSIIYRSIYIVKEAPFASKKLKHIDKGVYEIKIFYGPGYRVYLFFKQFKIIILNAGDKSSQAQDIKKAMKYRKLYEL